MAYFEKKTWSDRNVEYPSRYQINYENGTNDLVTIDRSEGSISNEGDALNASTFNDLEDRLGIGFDNAKANTEWKTLGTVSGASVLNMPNLSQYEEIQIVVVRTITENSHALYSKAIPVSFIPTTYLTVSLAGAYSGTYTYFSVTVQFNIGYLSGGYNVSILSVSVNGNEFTSDCVLTLLAR